jgi:hypothetical protein
MEILGDTVQISLHNRILKTWINIRFVCLRKECLERTANPERKTTYIYCSHGENGPISCQRRKWLGGPTQRQQTPCQHQFGHTKLASRARRCRNPSRAAGNLKRPRQVLEGSLPPPQRTSPAVDIHQTCILHPIKHHNMNTRGEMEVRFRGSLNPALHGRTHPA